MNINKNFSVILGVVLLTAAAGPASASTKDDVRDLQARMEIAEKSLSAQSAAAVRVGELEREIQLLTGQVEELTYRLELSNQRLNAISAALSGDAAMPAGGGVSRAGAAARGPVDLASGDPIGDQIDQSNVPDQASSFGGGDITLPLDPDAAFIYASGFLMQSDYQSAKSAFELYVEAFPNHSRTPEAQFRLGEIHLALGENAAAADVFISHIRNYPNDQRAAEAYLKLGTSFVRLEKSSEACTVFKTMKTKFPNAPTPVRQRADLEMARINCQ